MSKFKVGDRVRVYGLDRNLDPASVVTTITELLPEGQLYTDEAKSVTDSVDFSMVHPKQCRKLVKKPRRRLWIKTDGPLSAIGKPLRLCETVELLAAPTESGYIEFVEARRKK